MAAPDKIKPMLAEQTPIPAQNPEGFIWEQKFDGARIIAFKDGNRQYLQARSGSNKTEALPEIKVETKLPAVLDGEVIGANGETFQDSVQHRINKVNNIGIASMRFPLKYMVFDVIEVDGKNIEALPLMQRKQILSQLLIPNPTCELVTYTEDGLNLWNQLILPNALEGMVGKLKTGTYKRDAREWKKVKAWRRNYGMTSTKETFLVVGYTQGTGWRESTFGSMVLGRLEADGSTTFVGEVGTGMNQADITALMAMFSPVPFCPWPKEPCQAKWVKPFAIKLQYLEYSNDGIVRFPSFKGVV